MNEALLNELLRELAPILARSAVVLGIVLVLVLWAAVSGFWLWTASTKLSRAFRRAAAQALVSADESSFALGYETFSASVSGFPVIGPSWDGFRRTLVVPAVPGRPVMATSDLREWFDLAGLFRAAGADLRYHAALPGLLVGAGLMVTFLGLAAALTAASDVVAEGVSQAERNTALRTLLGAASVKFVTSLVGLALSIIYALFRKWCLRSVEQAFSGFAAALDARMPFRTSAYLQAESNVLLEKQYADIQRIGTDFFVNLGSTLERTFDSGLDQHIGPLREAIDKLAGGLSTQNQDAMQAMMRAFLDRLEGAVGESMRGTTATLDALGARLDGLQAGLDAAAGRMSAAAEEMASGMGRGAETALGGIKEQMELLVRSLRDAADEAARGSRAAGDDLASRMAETSASLSAAAAAFQERLEAGAADGAARLTAPLEALLLQLRDLSSSQRAAGAEAATELAATVTRSADALEATAAKVAEVLGGGAQDASARLVAATEAMRDDLRGVLDRFGTALNESGHALAQGAVTGGESLRDAAASLGGDINAMAARLAKAGEDAGAALRGGAADAQVSLTQSATALATGSSSLADRLAALGTASASLAERTQTLDRATRSVETPLAAAAADLRTAAQAAQIAAAPLRASANGLTTAAAALAAAQREADQLAGRLSEAAARFAGLDEGLARTLRALGDGLKGYQENIGNFVGGIDGALARSVEGLSAIAKGLEDTIEDMSRKANGRAG